MQKSRRDFLKTASVTSMGVGLTSLLGGCTHLDEWFMGESRDDRDKVVIVGGGIAGLTAAYQLKKNQVPFRLYEGSRRFGGRTWSLRDINISSQYADLGGERIEMEHAAIQNLCKELKVGLSEISNKRDFLWYEKDKTFSEKAWKTETQELQNLFTRISLEAYGSSPQVLSFKNKDQFSKAVLLDQMSAGDLFSRLSKEISLSARLFLEQLIRYQWGVESGQISSLQLVHWMRDSFHVGNSKHFKVSGGSSILTQALFDRVASVLPERFVKFDQKLIAARKETDHWRLIFATANREVEIKAQNMICTLPPAQLRAVDGWEKIPMSEPTRDLLAAQALGEQSKLIIGFQQRFWRNHNDLNSGSTILMDLPMQNFSEAGVPPSQLLSSIHGILQSQVGGPEAAKVGLHSFAELVREVQKLDLKIDNKLMALDGVEHVQNWQASPWSGGSRAYRKPGQFQQVDPDANAEWAFAGDAHSAAYLGTMNGAVQSAVEAANRFIKA